jgi:hypothetical protein
MKKTVLWLLVLVMALSLASLACDTLMGSGDDGDTVETPGDTTTDDSQDSTEAEQPDSDDTGDDTGDSGEADMVQNIPVPGDAADMVDATVAGNVVLSFNTAMSIQEVVDFYKDHMGDAGYSVDTESVTAQGAGLVFSGGPAGTVTLAVGPDPLNANRTTVGVTATP